MKFSDLPYVIPEALLEMSNEDLLLLFRSVRNSYLAESDWTQLPDSPLTESKRAEWATYRQELRDILETNSGDLLDIEFPISPDQTA